MKTFLILSFGGLCAAAGAQTPASNPMPDGSRDLYLGLGAVSEPDYLGGAARRVRALPLVQLEWNSGVFISGLSAGMHLSRQPSLEYGPLLAWRVKRGEQGMGGGADGVANQSIPGAVTQRGGLAPSDGALVGMDPVKGSLQAGAFANFYLTPRLRLTNSLLYGAGKWRDGVVWNVGVQRTAADLTPHHRLTWSAGVTMVNRSYNDSYYGVGDDESLRSAHRAYSADGGVQDVYVGAGWNWALSPHWIVASRARVTLLQGDARHSPLVQRPTNFSLSTGLAYRF